VTAGLDACPCGGPIQKLGQWCTNCYQRWLRAGRPEEGPQPPLRPWARTLAGRLEDYAEIRAQTRNTELAAQRLGIHMRTAERYEARLRAQQQA
jgi:hypothetical protein